MSIHPDHTQLTTLLTRAATAVLEPHVAGHLPLKNATAAYDKVASNGQRDRRLLTP